MVEERHDKNHRYTKLILALKPIFFEALKHLHGMEDHSHILGSLPFS